MAVTEFDALTAGYSQPALIVDQSCDVLAANTSFWAISDELYELQDPDCRLRCDQAQPFYDSDSDQVCKIAKACNPDKFDQITMQSFCNCDVQARDLSILGFKYADSCCLVVFNQQQKATQNLLKIIGGVSENSRHLMQVLELTGKSNNPILLIGEPGNVKTKLARAIHDFSPRSAQPFVPLLCTGTKSDLLERQLFGYGNTASKDSSDKEKGILGNIDGGTLVLTEIGDLPYKQQLKLLQVLETAQYSRSGGIKMWNVDFRLIATTSKDLRAEVDDGKFLKQLYYEVNVCPVEIPPLRERPEDIPVIASALVCDGQENQLLIDPQTYLAMMNYEFPGNIRELKSMLKRAALFATDGVILPKYLPPEVFGGKKSKSKEKDEQLILEKKIIPLRNLEETYIWDVYNQYEGDKKQLASQLGISERTLYRKLKKLRNADPVE